MRFMVQCALSAVLAMLCVSIHTDQANGQRRVESSDIAFHLVDEDRKAVVSIRGRMATASETNQVIELLNTSDEIQLALSKWADEHKQKKSSAKRPVAQKPKVLNFERMYNPDAGAIPARERSAPSNRNRDGTYNIQCDIDG